MCFLSTLQRRTHELVPAITRFWCCAGPDAPDITPVDLDGGSSSGSKAAHQAAAITQAPGIVAEPSADIAPVEPVVATEQATGLQQQQQQQGEKGSNDAEPFYINSMNKWQLEGIHQIGPNLADSIIKERTNNGPFKNHSGLKARIKYIGKKHIEYLIAAGVRGLGIDGRAAA